MQKLNSVIFGLLLTATGGGCEIPQPLFADETHDLEQQIGALQAQQKAASDQFEQGARLKGQGALMQQDAQAAFQTLAAPLAELQHKLDEAKKSKEEHNPKKDSATKPAQ